jgi:hypothetical protein
MLACHYRFPKLCLAVALVLFTTSSLAVAAHSGDGSRPLYAGKRFVPIGKLYSLGAVMIDGRTLSGEQSLWGGEQIWAKEASANVHLDGVGQVLLYRGSMARLLMSVPLGRAVIDEPVLTVVVSAGEIAMSLDSDASARVVVNDTVFRASRGAKFRIHTADDERAFEVKTGVIIREALPQDQGYLVSWEAIDYRTNRPTGPSSGRNKVQTNKTTKIGVKAPPKSKVSRVFTNASFLNSPLPQSDQIIVGLEVRFCLVSDPTIGVFLPSRSSCEIGKVEPSGVAVVVFQAGPNKGSSTVRATVVSSPNDYKDGVIEVVKPPLWRGRNILILAAALGGIICAFKCHPRSTPPLQQVPPPNTLNQF